MTDFDVLNNVIEQWFTGGKLTIQGQQTTLLDKIVILENGKICVMLHFDGFEKFYMNTSNDMLTISEKKFEHIFTTSIFSQLKKV